MKKLNKKDYLNILIILSAFFFYIILINILGYKYGSVTDWICQHYALPNYLRILFYETKDIFPNFAFQLGSGQNIYYLIYHGLFNPLIMISYLLPFIKMYDYIIILNITMMILSVIFMYKYLDNKFDKKVTFLTTFIFALCGPLVYHSHRHLMFINYMPFLILALINIDNYFEKKKKSGLIISIFLIITISYLYSVGAIITIFIYGLYKYLTIHKKIVTKKIIKDMLIFIITIIIPIVMSLFIIIPTFYTILTGRSDTTVSINLLNLIIPSNNIEKLFYNAYGIGIPFIVVFALINNILNNKREKRYLNILLLLVLFLPIFNYILNGFMYIDGKSLIPLIPLYIYILGVFFKDLFNNKYNSITSFIVLVITFLLSITNLNSIFTLLLITDFIITIILINIYKKKKNYYLFIVPLLIFYFFIFLGVNLGDKLVTKEEFNIVEYYNNIKVNYDDDNIYRTANNNNLISSSNNINSNNYYSTSIYTSIENPYYTNFIKNIFQTDFSSRHYHELTQNSNLLFNIYMGNKYLISTYPYLGYNKIATNTYVNNDVFSIGYSSNLLMSRKEFDRLEYPYTIDALLNYTIVEENIDNVYKPNIYKYTNDYSISNIKYTKENDKYILDLEEDTDIDIKLKDVNNKILILTFDMNYAPNCTFCSNSITINNIKNTISGSNWKYYNYNDTFHYIISNYEEENTLKINLTKGHYEISNINIYTMDYDTIKEINHDNFIFNKELTKGDILEGDIDVTNDGYFKLSIPYDKGFSIYVDEEKTPYKIVDTSFIGFRIKKGYHHIKIKYTAPFSKISKYGSFCGIIIFIIMFILERRKRSEKN